LTDVGDETGLWWVSNLQVYVAAGAERCEIMDDNSYAGGKFQKNSLEQFI
jgi:hypothetical protein